MRGAIHEAEVIFAAVDGADFETERTLMSEPPCDCRGEFVPKIRANIEIGHAGAAAEPLEDAADGEIGLELTDIDGNGSGGLVAIEDDVCSYAMGTLDDGA